MFTVTVAQRWSDLDAQGHVNNALVTDYLQEARAVFLRQGPSTLLHDGVVVVGQQVEYVSSLSLGGVDAHMGVASVGGSRFQVWYDLVQDGDVAVRARTTLCGFDFDAGRPRRLDDVTRAFLEGWHSEVDPLRAVEAPPLDGRGTPTPVTVRWSDLDRYGHVNNTVFFDYVQQARIDATTSWDPSMARAGSAGSQHRWLVARQDVDHLAQLRHLDQPLRAVTAPVKLGRTSIVLAGELRDPSSDVCYARSRTVLVCADTDERPTPLPDSLRERLEPHVVA